MTMTVANRSCTITHNASNSLPNVSVTFVGKC